jgi:hypothetical protein
VVGQDAIGIELPQALEVDQMAVEPVGLGEEGDGVLQRVAGQQQALVGEPDDRGIVAMTSQSAKASVPAM